jgi:hypothetical protein
LERGPQTEENSQKVPGQPWHIKRGIASDRGERAWTKWMLIPSRRVLKCGTALIEAWIGVQSYECSQVL